jgi:type 1 glutamine amidotransferase
VTKLFIPALLLIIAAAIPGADVPPLKILLLTGGCCHDYKTQKDVLKTGLEARLFCNVTQIHAEQSTAKPELPIYGHPDYATGYDVVIHDECAAGQSDAKLIQGVLKTHQDGIPGVNLHCAMHSYRNGDYRAAATAGTPTAAWFEYLGLQSTGHGSQAPITISYVDHDSPIVKGLSDWTTIKEELYNNVQVFGAQVLARGAQKQKIKNKDTGVESEVDANAVVTWTNLYGDKKTRVFSTTIGHNTDTVADPRYLELVARGVLWATNHLTDAGAPAPGYGRQP